MIKNLTKHGNSLALVIERAVLDLLKIDADTPLDISTDGQVLIVSPVRDAERQKKFKKALEKTNRRYGKALKKTGGLSMTPDFLSLAEVLEIHRDQIERYGGKTGIRDLGLLRLRNREKRQNPDGVTRRGSALTKNRPNWRIEIWLPTCNSFHNYPPLPGYHLTL